jgi:DNA adenine methylase
MGPSVLGDGGYGVEFDISSYQALAVSLGSIKGRAILSVNDHPTMRSVFGAFQYEIARIDYIVSGPDKRVSRHELIVYSWNRTADPAGLF